MLTVRLMRDYENPELPLAARLPSLGRRFPCLGGAVGLDPWRPDELLGWATAKGQGSAAWYAVHLLLNLAGSGPWDDFDAVAAINAFGEPDRRVFATWALSWKS